MIVLTFSPTFVVMGDGDGGRPTLYLLLPFSVLPQLLTKFSYYRLVVDLYHQSLTFLFSSPLT